MHEIMIREANIGDTREIAQLSGELGYPSSTEEINCRVNQIMKSSQNTVFIAVASDDTVVGWIHVFETIRLTSEKFLEIGGIVVSENYRHRGIGKSLLAYAERWAVEKGLAKIRVRSRTSRKDAHSFFVNSGFQLFKSQEVFDKTLVT